MVLATTSDTGPTGERPLGADGTTNAETSELGVAASATHDAASAVTGKEGIVSEKYHWTHAHLETWWKRMRMPGRGGPMVKQIYMGYPPGSKLSCHVISPFLHCCEPALQLGRRTQRQKKRQESSRRVEEGMRIELTRHL